MREGSQVVMSSPFIVSPLDFKSLRSNGYICTTVTSHMASMLLRCVKSERFVDDFESKTGDGYTRSETEYSNMYVAKDRMGDRPGGFYEVWLSNLMAWAKPYVGMYMNAPTGLDAHLAITECRNGYHMDWHHDVGERGVALALLYLSERDIEKRHGGELLVSKVHRDARGNPHSREVTGVFTPAHGRLVLLDASSTRFEHKVEEYKNNEFNRYCLAAVLGMPRSENV